MICGFPGVAGYRHTYRLHSALDQLPLATLVPPLSRLSTDGACGPPHVQAALAAAAYRPRSPTDALKAILENHLEEFLKGYDDRFRTTYGPMHPRVRDLLESYIPCRDLHFGFLRFRCCNSDCNDKTERLVLSP